MTTKPQSALDIQPKGTLQDWINDFLLTKRRKWRPHTLQGYIRVLKLYSTYVGVDHWPPTRQDVLRWLDHVEQNGCSKTTIHTYWIHLRTFFNYLEKTGVLSPLDNPARQIQKLEIEPDKPDLPPVAFPPEDLERLFQYLDGKAKAGKLDAIRDLALLHFAYVTGAREGEIASLTLDSFKLSARETTILPETSKSKKKRYVYFDDEVCQSLKNWLNVRPGRPGVSNVFVALGGRWPKGSPLLPGALYGILQRRCGEAGISRRKFHALRHTSVIDALDAGISPDKVQKQMGHASIQTTMTYMRGRDEDRARAYREHSLARRLSKRAAQRRLTAE